MNTTKTISILFYKGSGTLLDKLVRFWTRSQYSHCEFRRSDGLCHSNDRFTLISRTQLLEISSDEWESCDLVLPSLIVERIERRQLKKNGTQYDWRGIFFSHVFEIGWHSKAKWFCSKSNADDLLYAYKLMVRTKNPHFAPFLETLKPLAYHLPHELSPRDLFQLMPSNL